MRQSHITPTGLATALACSLGLSSVAVAGGIDRSGQPIDIIFREGNFAELSFARTIPDVGGDDVSGSVGGIPTDATYEDVAQPFSSYAFGLKFQLTEAFSLSLIGAEDFGSDVRYDDIPGSNLGGTSAISDTYALSLVGRYAFTENWSVHGGVRAQWASGDIELGGLAYGGPSQLPGSPIPSGVSGYEVEFDQNLAFGYLIGGAFELPQYAARVAVTYFSPITHDFSTSESFAVDVNQDRVADIRSSPDSDETDVELPQSVNIDFQTGIAPNLLLFGGARWAEWTAFEISPENFSDATNTTLVTLDEDTITYRLGLGYRITDNWSVLGQFTYEPPGDRLKSPLAPTTGFQQIDLGARYTTDSGIEVGVGIRQRYLGDAFPETGTPDVARADFDENTSTTLGVRVGYSF